MKTKALLWIAVLGLAVGACSTGGGGEDDGGITELALRRTVSGTIGRVGDVDWYHFRAVEANNVLRIRVTSDTVRPDVDLSVAVYEEDGSGNRVRLYGDHAPDGGQVPADLELDVYVDAPKDLYIAVRDLLDDEASDRPYYLTVDFPDAGDAGDGNFAGAVDLAVGEDAEPVQDRIEYVGDVDCFRFDAAVDGVYAVNVSFSPYPGGTDVELAIDLYDERGQRVAGYAGPQRHAYQLVPHLAAGTYYVVVQDFGRDDADEASPYGISVVPVAADEVAADDRAEDAAALVLDAGTGAYRAQGSLDYLGDEDWYAVPDPGPGAGIPVLELAFDDAGSDAGFRYNVQLVDADAAVVVTHDYVGGSTTYRTQVRADAGPYLVRVRAADGQDVTGPAAYTVATTALWVDDPAEAAPGNDTIDTALALDPEAGPADGWAEGRVAYRGDEDWYTIATDTGAYRVLEVFLETDEATRADLALSVIGDDLVDKVADTYGEDGPTRLETSLLLAPSDPVDPISYFFRVADGQGDEGEPDVPYRIRAHLAEIPAELPADAGAPGAVYYSEADEAGDAAADPVRLELNALLQRRFNANTTLLAFNGPTVPDGVTRTAAYGVTTITLPWIGGYVDYRGDQDWFALDL